MKRIFKRKRKIIPSLRQGLNYLITYFILFEREFSCASLRFCLSLSLIIRCKTMSSFNVLSLRFCIKLSLYFKLDQTNSTCIWIIFNSNWMWIDFKFNLVKMVIRFWSANRNDNYSNLRRFIHWNWFNRWVSVKELRLTHSLLELSGMRCIWKYIYATDLRHLKSTFC